MGGKHKGMSETQNPASQSTTYMDGSTDAFAATDETVSHLHPFESALTSALDASNIADARTLVANAEAVLFGHKASDAAQTEPTTQAQLAAAKARIAIATGDGAAARAILVQAIERNPKTTALRALMTEVMMAEGRATDVRSVLRHIGNGAGRDRPATPDTQVAGPTLRDTSG